MSAVATREPCFKCDRTLGRHRFVSNGGQHLLCGRCFTRQTKHLHRDRAGEEMNDRRAKERHGWVRTWNARRA